MIVTARSSTWRRLGAMLPIGVLCAALAWASDVPAQAAEPTPTAKEVAKKRYLAGVKAFEAKRFKDAIDLFLEADRLAPSAALSFNIARAYEGIADSEGALRWYRDYLRRKPDASDKDEVTATIRKLEKRLERKGVQQVTVMSEPTGATVVVDDRPVGVTPWTGELPPGKHRLAARLRGYSDVERSFELAADRSLDLTVRLVPAEDAPPPVPTTASPPPEPPPEPPPTETPPPPPVEPDGPADEGGIGMLTWIALGAGTATLGAAGFFELSRQSAEDDARADRTQIGYADKLDTMESRQTTARILAGVGGALFTAGAVLLVIDLTGGEEKATVGWGCSTSGCGAQARGAF